MVNRIIFLLQFISILLCFFHTPTFSKNTSCKNKFKDEDFIYCTKYGSPTTGMIESAFKGRFTSTYKKLDEKIELEIGVYQEKQWEEVEGNKKMLCDEKRQKAQFTIPLEIPVDGSWSINQKATHYNYHLPRMYYYVIMDCEHKTHSKVKTMPKIEIEMEIYTAGVQGPDHFSYEEQGSVRLYTILLFVYAAVFGITIYSYIRFSKMFERYDSPHFVVIIGVFLQMSGIFMKLIHFWVYSNNGRGVPIFDIFSLISLMLAEISISCLFMMLAYGWTLSFQEIDWDNNLEVYLPVGSIVVAIHLVLAAMTYIDVDASHKYHDFAGIQGLVLVLFKMCLFAYFYYCYESNKHKIPKRATEFHRILIVLGSGYFMTIPMTIFSSYFLMPYQRQFFYTMVTNIVQLVACCLLIQQSTSTKSKYFKASLESQGILPMDKSD